MILEAVLLTLFLLSGFALAHTYFLYPITLQLWTRFVSYRGAAPSEDRPSVALIIAAYNEEEVIAEKIENSLQLEYPEDELDIVVFSDASDDRTDEIVEEYEDQGVSLVRIEGRVGKTECQNRVADLVDEDILVFSDANSMYEPDAISELVSRFVPEVGCVVGELRYREAIRVLDQTTRITILLARHGKRVHLRGEGGFVRAATGRRDQRFHRISLDPSGRRARRLRSRCGRVGGDRKFDDR